MEFFAILIYHPFFAAFLSGFILLIISALYLPYYLKYLNRPRFEAVLIPFDNGGKEIKEAGDDFGAYRINIINLGSNTINGIYYNLLFPKSLGAKLKPLVDREKNGVMSTSDTWSRPELKEEYYIFRGSDNNKIFPACSVLLDCIIYLNQDNKKINNIHFQLGTEYGEFPHIGSYRHIIGQHEIGKLPKVKVSENPIILR